MSPENGTTGKSADELIEQYEPFILRTASTVARRPVSRSDDEWSVALSAFWEATRSYTPARGSLEAYAGTVIRRRLVDYYRANARFSAEVPVEPILFSGDAEEEQSALQHRIERETAAAAQLTDLPAEISLLRDILRQYSFDFFDLTECCPKAKKTRLICFKAAKFVCASEPLLRWMRRQRRLPAKEMETGVPVSRKILDKFRRYIITAIEITAGDFPGLKSYLIGGLDGKEDAP